MHSTKETRCVLDARRAERLLHHCRRAAQEERGRGHGFLCVPPAASRGRVVV